MTDMWLWPDLNVTILFMTCNVIKEVHMYIILQEKFLQNFKHEVILFYFEQLIILKIRKVHENVKQKICIKLLIFQIF